MKSFFNLIPKGNVSMQGVGWFVDVYKMDPAVQCNGIFCNPFCWQASRWWITTTRHYKKSSMMNETNAELHLHPFETDTHLLPSDRAVSPFLLWLSSIPIWLLCLFILPFACTTVSQLQLMLEASSSPYKGTEDKMMLSRAVCLTWSFLAPLGPSCVTKDQGYRACMGHPPPEDFEAGTVSVPDVCLHVNSTDGWPIWRGEQA